LDLQSELGNLLAKAALCKKVINADELRSTFIKSNEWIQGKRLEVEKQEKLIETLKANVDALNQDKISTQSTFYELKTKVIGNSSQKGADIVFALNPKILNSTVLEAGDVCGLQSNIELASNLSAVLLKRMELQEILSALKLKRNEETMMRISLEDKIAQVEKYERDLQRLDRECTEAEAEWSAVFHLGTGRNQPETVAPQESQPRALCWEDQPVPQFDEQFVQNLFEVAGSQQESIVELEQKIEKQRLEIADLTTSSTDTMKAMKVLEDQKCNSEPFFKCAEYIRVRKYELELPHWNETRVKLGNLAAHQGCVIVDAYQFLNGVLDSKKHLQTFKKWYGDVTPEVVWEGRGCEKFIKMLDWGCGMYDFTSQATPGYEESDFARYFNVVMEDNKGKPGAKFEDYLTQHITGIKAMELMEIEFGFALLAHKNPNNIKKRS